MGTSDTSTTASPGTLAALAHKYETLVALRARRDRGGAAATRAAAGAAAGGAREPWMDWIAAYHGAMTDALAARARGEAVDAPEGRLNVKVLRELGARFGVPASRIAETLFPVRRPSPYAL
jgi:hypothetical protein